MTLQQLAAQVRSQFAQDTRNNGETFWSRKTGTDDWIQELCHAAHGNMMPDDWRYEMIVEALDAYAEYDDPDEAECSIEADIYTYELTGWLHSRNDRYSYVDDAATEYGERGDLLEQLSLGQIAEKREVYASVRRSLEARLEYLKSPDDETLGAETEDK
jgi:hypothetical protein